MIYGQWSTVNGLYTQYLILYTLNMNDQEDDKPPLFASWKQWYLFVLVFLFVLIVLFKLFTNYFS